MSFEAMFKAKTGATGGGRRVYKSKNRGDIVDVPQTVSQIILNLVKLQVVQAPETEAVSVEGPDKSALLAVQPGHNHIF